MSDARCDECGKGLTSYEVFGTLKGAYCNVCWKEVHAREANGDPRWYRHQLILLKCEIDSVREALLSLETKHNHLISTCQRIEEHDDD